jgi:multiple sugar transport system ATP-binding protein
VQEVAAMLEITDILGRKPAELGGGQKQRVSLARALVREPDVFLMDEPLSHLDAAQRAHMRSELKRLHARTGRTTVVTHDQCLSHGRMIV